MTGLSTAVTTGLLVALACLGLLVAALLHALADLQHRVLSLETAAARRAVAPSPHPVGAVPAPAPAAVAGTTPDGDGDVVPLRGTRPDGQPVELRLDDGTWLVAFLSTSCAVCTAVWQRLSAGELDRAGGAVRAVVVVKDPDVEDADAVRVLSPGAVPVVLSSEAWRDYEVPGSPYLLLLDGVSSRVLSEGPVRGWDDVLRMVARAG
ncbi:MAG: hypothetical protein JWL64_1180 [Frankiales bacterium]|nr:hypothetical protein [Frankiales bacterium]